MLCHTLRYKETRFDKNLSRQRQLNTTKKNNSETEYDVEVDLKRTEVAVCEFIKYPICPETQKKQFLNTLIT